MSLKKRQKEKIIMRTITFFIIAIICIVISTSIQAQTYNIPSSSNVVQVKDSMVFVSDKWGITVVHIPTYKIYNTPVNGGEVKIIYTKMYSYWMDDTIMVQSVVHTGAEQNITVDTSFTSHIVSGIDQRTTKTKEDMYFVNTVNEGEVLVFKIPSYKKYDTEINK